MSENLTEKDMDFPAPDVGVRPIPKVSVIVPVYKVEKYLPECIESILAQTFKDFELILVDDGSPDNSGKICDDYATRDSRIRVFHKENGGVTSARRLGVENARGEWVMFVDGDDELFSHAVGVLIKYTGRFDSVDLIEGYVTNQKPLSSFNSEGLGSTRRISGREYAVAIASYRYFWYPFPVAKIIRREVLVVSDALNVPAWVNFAEDLLMNLRVALKIREAIKIFSDIYFYRSNPKGACNTIKRSASYYCRFLCEVEKNLPGGINGPWRDVWVGVARYRFVEMFFRCPDWDSLGEPKRKILSELSKERYLSLGTRISLRVEGFPRGLKKMLRCFLGILLRIHLCVIRRNLIVL